MSCPKRSLLDLIYAAGILCFLSSLSWAQGEGADVHELLKDEILSPAVAEFQIRQYIIQNTAALPKPPATAQEDPDKNCKNLQKAMTKLFKNYPPQGNK